MYQDCCSAGSIQTCGRPLGFADFCLGFAKLYPDEPDRCPHKLQLEPKSKMLLTRELRGVKVCFLSQSGFLSHHSFLSHVVEVGLDNGGWAHQYTNRRSNQKDGALKTDAGAPVSLVCFLQAAQVFRDIRTYDLVRLQYRR